MDAQQEQIELLQEKLEQMQAVHTMDGGEKTESAGHTGPGDVTDSINDTMEGSEPPVIPPAPPPPPIDGMPPTFGMCHTTSSSHHCIQLPSLEALY